MNHDHDLVIKDRRKTSFEENEEEEVNPHFIGEDEKDSKEYSSSRILDQSEYSTNSPAMVKRLTTEDSFWSTSRSSVSTFIFDKSPVMGQVMNEKVLQAIDFIEIGLRALIDDDCIYHPLALRFKDAINYSLLFKLLIFYERVNLIEMLLIEIKCEFKTEELLKESMEYALSIDKMRAAIFIFRKFHN